MFSDSLCVAGARGEMSRSASGRHYYRSNSPVPETTVWSQQISTLKTESKIWQSTDVDLPPEFISGKYSDTKSSKDTKFVKDFDIL